MNNRNVVMAIRRLLVLLVMGLAAVLSAKADNVTVEANAPSSVQVGKPFQLSYVVNGSADGITLPDVDGLSVLMGPSTMTSSSYSYINGKPSSSRQTTFTYVVKATKVGKVSIPPAKVNAGGTSVSSNALSITVAQGEAQPSGSGQSAGSGSSSAPRSSDELFIRQSLSKSSVYEGEATELVTKVYTRVQLQSLSDFQMPDLADFVTSELGGRDITFHSEFIDGREYQVGELSRKALIPQKSGKLTVPPAEAEFVVRRRIRSGGGLFDDFFGNDTQLSRQRVKAAAVTVNVKPLPAGKPANFSGGVGQFKFKVEVEPSETKVDNSVQVKVSVEGSGNLKILTLPKPQFHQDFDSFDPNSKNDINAVGAGFSGRRTDEYLIIPRREGSFEIPQLQFSYFDPQKGDYVKLSQGPFTINVAKGDGSSSNQGGAVSFSGAGPEKVTYTGSDLRYLHKSGSLSKKDSFFVLSPLFWVLTALPVAVLAVLTVFYRQRMFENANVSLVKSRKANKAARKRLNQAAKYIKADKREAFFDEVMRALWGYLSDKLTLPLSELTKDNARDKMSEHGVPSDVADEFMSLLEECEFARYAPASATSTMDEVYAKAADVIGKIEANAKK